MLLISHSVFIFSKQYSLSYFPGHQKIFLENFNLSTANQSRLKKCNDSIVSFVGHDNKKKFGQIEKIIKIENQTSLEINVFEMTERSYNFYSFKKTQIIELIYLENILNKCIIQNVKNIEYVSEIKYKLLID